MKKILAVMMAALMMFGVCDLSVLAAEDLQADVNVTIADKGTLVVTQETITVTDIDGDESLTINDALYAAHEAMYTGGAAEGYASAYTQWGLGITKLWGDTSGNFGYRVNDASAWSLENPVADGDDVYAYVYSDGEYYSDTYSYFDVKTIAADAGENIELTLLGAGYDADWNPISVPVEGAVITVNGAATNVKTDAEGKAVIQIEEGGDYVISAVSDDQILVPPVCLAQITSVETADVYVTISDKDGKLVLTQEEVTVSDVDEDGQLTINDALYAAHEAYFEGGAAKGYAASYTQWGLSVTKLWGTENGGSYGYYVNNESAWSLTDVVEEGDYINAFIYTDLTYWSDTYCYFDANTVKTSAGEEVTLTLSMYGYDADWNKIVMPVEGAVITVNGEKTEFVTDKDGKVTMTFDAEGTYVISAESETLTLVPPVCKVAVSKAPVTDTKAETDDKTDNSADGNKETAPKTGDNTVIYTYVILAAAALASVGVLFDRRRKSYER